MTESRQERVEKLFWQASQIDSKAGQDAFLQEACGADSALRQEVEGFLGDVTAADALVKTCQLAMPLAHESEVGKTIGPYKLREKLGEGGFGVVYAAEQQEPIRRKVALKLIKPGMDSRQIVARFEAERQALALMDHPNIARVYDAGTTEAGLPYFVMELVNGLPITDYAENQQLSVDERLELMTAVCEAVEHAHKKGIIHRDLKPSNVLVTLHDGQPVVKIIDFGVAKALHHRLSENTVYTAVGQMVGTPMYMSPEQAEMSGLDVDTRSDVYSLGVLLYELLTKLPPFDRDSFRKAGLEAMLKMIRETEPLRPSLRVSTARNRVSIKDPRNINIRQLSASLSGELDWVVMKALEKQRGRRYQSARELGQDLKNYLADNPVAAGPPSSWYRFRKTFRRNRLAITTAALVSVSLLVGTGFSIWYSIEAAEAQHNAEESEKVAHQRLLLLQQNQQALENERTLLREEKRKLEQSREQSERRFGLAKQAVSELVTEVATHKLSAFPELADFRESLLLTAEQFYSKLAEESPQDDSVYLSRAEVRRLMNRFDDSLKDYQKAAAINPASYPLQLSLSDFYRNANGFAPRDYSLALQHAEQAVELAPHHKGGWVLLAWAHSVQNSPESLSRASAAMRRASDLTQSEGQKVFHLANALEFEGDFEAAVLQYKRAEELGSESPSEAPFRRGCCLKQLKRYDEAIEAINEALTIDAFQPRSYEVRASANYALQRYEEAALDWQRAFDLAPQRPLFLSRLLECYLRSGNYPAATELLETLDGSIAEENGLLSAEFVQEIDSTGHDGLRAVHDHLIDEVAAGFEETDDNLGLALFYEQKGRYAEAATVLDGILANRGDEIGEEGEKKSAADLATLLAQRFRDQGKIAEAIGLFRKATSLQPNQAKYKIRLGMTLRWWNSPPEVHEAEAIELFRSAVELDPENFAASGQLARSLATAIDPSLRDGEQAIFYAQARLELRPQGNRAYGLANLAMARYSAGNWKKAIEICKEAQQAEGNSHAPLDLFLAMAHAQLGETEESQRWYAAALARLDAESNTILDNQILEEARELLGENSTN